MTIKIMKWGNSNGVLLSKEILSNAELKTGDEVEIIVDSNKNIILKKPNRRLTFEELFEGWDGDYVMAEELDWGEPAGEEVW